MNEHMNRLRKCRKRSKEEWRNQNSGDSDSRGQNINVKIKMYKSSKIKMYNFSIKYISISEHTKSSSCVKAA